MRQNSIPRSASAALQLLRKRCAPVSQGLRVVQPQDLNIGHKKARALDGRKHLAKRRDIAAGEYVLGDERVRRRRNIEAADGVNDSDAVVGKQLENPS